MMLFKKNFLLLIYSLAFFGNSFVEIRAAKSRKKAKVLLNADGVDSEKPAPVLTEDEFDNMVNQTVSDRARKFVLANWKKIVAGVGVCGIVGHGIYLHLTSATNPLNESKDNEASKDKIDPKDPETTDRLVEEHNLEDAKEQSPLKQQPNVLDQDFSPAGHVAENSVEGGENAGANNQFPERRPEDQPDFVASDDDSSRYQDVAPAGHVAEDTVEAADVYNQFSERRQSEDRQESVASNNAEEQQPQDSPRLFLNKDAAESSREFSTTVEKLNHSPNFQRNYFSTEEIDVARKIFFSHQDWTFQGAKEVIAEKLQNFKKSNSPLQDITTFLTGYILYSPAELLEKANVELLLIPGKSDYRNQVNSILCRLASNDINMTFLENNDFLTIVLGAFTRDRGFWKTKESAFTDFSTKISDAFLNL